MKKFLDYGASIVAVLIIVAVWRFVLHYLFAPDGPLQYVPKDWVAGTQGVVLAFLVCALSIFASFCLYLGVTHWIRKVGGKYGRWILDEPERA